MSSVFLIRLSWIVLGHKAHWTSTVIKRIHMMLGEEGDTQPRVLVDETLGRLELANEQLKHRRFTSTVRSNNSNTRVKLDVEIDVAEEGFIRRVSKSDFRHLHDWWGELLNFREPEVHTVLALWWFQDWHSLEFLDSGLCFRRLGSIVPELVDEG